MKTQLQSNIKLRFLLFLILFSCTLTSSRAALSSYGFSIATGVALDDSTSAIQLIATAQDNTSSVVTNIGFNFILNGTTYTQFSVNSNGLMRLGATVVSTVFLNSLASSTDLPKIAPYWDDLKTVGGFVKYKLTGTAPNRKLMVQWTVTVINNNSANQKFQVWLYETTNRVQFVYGTALPLNNGLYSIGLATATTDYLSLNTTTMLASSATVTDNNTAAIAAGTSYLFKVPPGCATITFPTAGATGLLLQNTLSWTAGTGVTTGYDVYFGTSANPPRVSYFQSASTYTPSILAFNTTYYWKIVARNDSAQALSCSVNQFTTGSPLNYEITRSTGITYNSIVSSGSVVTTGWRNGLSTDDNLSNAVPIGFNFGYNGNTVSSFLISTNGFITFNTTTSANGAGTQYGYLNGALSDGTPPSSPLIITPFYADVVCQGNSNTTAGLNASIKFLLSGTAPNRVMTIEWIGMEDWQTAGPNLNFQAKLYESTNVIELLYGIMEGFNGAFNLNYTFSVGINGNGVSSTPQIGEVLNQLKPNTRSFGLAPTQLSEVPECYSMIRFVPGTYSSYVPPASLRPSNDSLSTPILLPVYPTPCLEFCGTYFSSANATRSIPTAACANADDDVWFEFVANNTNTQIKVFGGGNYDATVELMNTSFVQLACANTIGAGLSETITTNNLVIGQHYLVRVYERGISWNPSISAGQFSICISAVPIPPTNNECANSINITVTGTPAVFIAGQSTAAASASAGIPVCSASGTVPDDDVWYSFTAVNTKEIIAVNSNNGFNAVIQLFSGTCASLTSLSCVNAVGNGQPESITMSNLTRNAVYRFRVYHSTLGGGSGSYMVSVSSPPPPCTGTMLPPNNSIEIRSSDLNILWEKIPGADNYRLKLDTVNPPLQTYIITIDTSVVIPSLLTGKKYYWTLNGGNATGFSSSCTIFNFTTELKPYAYTMRLFLQDLYTTNSKMKAYYNLTDTIADTISVDLVDLDSNVNYTLTLPLSVNGWATAYLPARALNLVYYLVIHHRNSLETWGNTFYLDSVDTAYNFTTSAAQAYGSNQVQMDPGVFAIYYGDLDQDRKIDKNDLAKMALCTSAFEKNYALGDLNADYLTESVDFSMLENQVARVLSTIRPFTPF